MAWSRSSATALRAAEPSGSEFPGHPPEFIGELKAKSKRVEIQALRDQNGSALKARRCLCFTLVRSQCPPLSSQCPGFHPAGLVGPVSRGLPGAPGLPLPPQADGIPAESSAGLGDAQTGGESAGAAAEPGRPGRGGWWVSFPETHHDFIKGPELTVDASLSGGFHGNSSFCLGEEEEVEIEVQEDFLSFDADLVAEQLTYMDAVSRRETEGGRAGR